MTESGGIAKRAIHTMSWGDTVFCLTSMLFLILTLFASELTSTGAVNGLRMCAQTLIPSLFPFMAVSSLIASSGAAELLGKPFAAPCRILFGISPPGACALVMGMLCGFPVGTKTALTLYENGRISKGELEHILMLANIPSAAFLINATGASLFGSKGFGIALYAVNIISAFVIGIISRPFFGSERLTATPRKSKKKRNGIALFTNAITDSAISMLYVCAFVVFFSALVSCVGELCSALPIREELSFALFGFFELTQGVSHASLCLSKYTGMLLASAITGWSGMSVHFQIMSICRDHSLSFKPYFLSKLFCSVINTALMALILAIFHL